MPVHTHTITLLPPSTTTLPHILPTPTQLQGSDRYGEGILRLHRSLHCFGVLLYRVYSTLQVTTPSSGWLSYAALFGFVVTGLLMSSLYALAGESQPYALSQQIPLTPAAGKGYSL